MCGGAVVAGTSYWTADLALTIAADDEVAKIRGPSHGWSKVDINRS